MGTSYNGNFGKTKGKKDYLRGLSEDKQGKHIVGHKNYIEGRSIFDGTIDDAIKLVNKFDGKGTSIGQGKERVDFGKVIGYYVDKATGRKCPTTVGIIHVSKDGKHIVPARPKNFGGDK